MSGIRTATAAAAVVLGLVCAPSAHAQVPNFEFYKVTSVTGTYDLEAKYISPTPPDCPGSYERQEHADVRLLTGKRAGGALTRGTGSLIAGARGGYDGVYRSLSCGGVLSSCEAHFGWNTGGALLTLTFRSGGRVTATLSSTTPRTDDCPLSGKNGFYLGRDRVTRAERRRGRFTLRFRQSEAQKVSSGEVVGSLRTSLRVVVRRTRS